MLALLEVEVSAVGGTYAFCDTDSMAIVAGKRARTITLHGADAKGRPVRQRVQALSWGKVEEIAGSSTG